MLRLYTRETGRVSSEVIAIFMIIPLSLGAKLTKMLIYENRPIVLKDIRQSFYSEICIVGSSSRFVVVVVVVVVVAVFFKRVSGLVLSKSNVCRFL